MSNQSPINPFLTRHEHREQLQRAVASASIAVMGEDSLGGYLRAQAEFDKAQKALEAFERACEPSYYPPLLSERFNGV